MNNETTTPLPIDSMNGQGMSVHLQYIRRDVDDLKTLQQKQHIEILNKLNELQALYPTRKEFEEFTKITGDHETRVRAIERTMWKWLGVASAVGVVASIVMQIIFKVA